MKKVFYRIKLGAIGLALLSMLASCGSSSNTEAELPPITGDVNLGKEVFTTYCTACHQQDGKGRAGFAPSINNIDFLQVADDHQIKRFILEGRPGTAMMAYKNNPEVVKDINNLVAYIRSFKDNFELYKPIPLDRKWVSKGDPVNGEKLYVNYCASCHGQKGEGYASGGSGTAIGNAELIKIAPDAYFKNTILHGRAGTAMKSFYGAKGLANMSEGDVDDVVAYLRTKAAYVEEVTETAAVAIGEKAEQPSTGFGLILKTPILSVLFFVTVALLVALGVLLLVIKNTIKAQS